jgi:thiosulfate/3-mercaptopyruvate sulfurtransferase
MNPDGTFKGWSTPSVDDRGLFRDASTLREQMESTGVTPDRWITTYCVRGGLSTHAWFVLTQLLGYPNVREYERSWVEWGNRAELPIAND